MRVGVFQEKTHKYLFASSSVVQRHWDFARAHRHMAGTHAARKARSKERGRKDSNISIQCLFQRMDQLSEWTMLSVVTMNLHQVK